jgi:hypothetical protein
VSLNELEVYFIAKDGTITEGRYADLR